VKFSLQAPVTMRTQEFQSVAPRTIASALGRFRERIRSISVWIEDVNGPRGGIDVWCRIEVQFVRRGRVSVSSMGRDQYTALSKAAMRARERIDRQIKKTRAARRQLLRA
jgi:putative sigma-54 modulation protein